MKICVQIILFYFSIAYCQGQNLITNPSFEVIDSCFGQASDIGFDVFQWSGCDGWSCPTSGSSDLWCENPYLGIGITPPDLVGFGYQLPLSGDNMCGLFTFVQHEEYREYIQNELTQELIPNKYYDLKINVNNSYFDPTINVATSCLEAYFSNSLVIQSSSYLAMNLVPQITNDRFNVISDTLNWVSIKGKYKAKGGEKYVIIGCFQDDSQIYLNREVSDTIGGNIYFFIDDIELTESTISVFFPNVFSPNGDLTNENYLPTIINVPEWKVYIQNRWGNVVAILDNQNPAWNGEINGETAVEGVYYYFLSSSNQKLNEHGFFHLVR